MKDIQSIISAVEVAVGRVASLGKWPTWLDARSSLLNRIPSGEGLVPGFDAGLACALGLIPEDKQGLAATLHVAYTEEAVEQIRQETAGEFDPDSEATWWLAGCSVCREGEVSTSAFFDQIEEFRRLASDPGARVAMAVRELDSMGKKFSLMDGIPFGVRDGALQGAYVTGYPFGVLYHEGYGIFFLGTFRPSLGLEGFAFDTTRVDGSGRPLSGPVHGSRQFVKVSAFEELAAAAAVVRKHLG